MVWENGVDLQSKFECLKHPLNDAQRLAGDKTHWASPRLAAFIEHICDHSGRLPKTSTSSGRSCVASFVDRYQQTKTNFFVHVTDRQENPEMYPTLMPTPSVIIG